MSTTINNPPLGENLGHARSAVAAAFLGWTLDAFDFFILILTFDEVAKTFGVSLTKITFAITLTLATRALGAFIFGRLADIYGRKPILIAVILLYSIFEFLSGFAWSFRVLPRHPRLLRHLQGGEWGIGSSLAMESIPSRCVAGSPACCRRAIHGLPAGHRIIRFLRQTARLARHVLRVAGATPGAAHHARRQVVKESPAFDKLRTGPKISIGTVLRTNAKLAIYGVAMMAAFNFFSHGTQDLYLKAHLGKQLHFSHAQISDAGLIFNVGAILGGIIFGLLSQKIGRRLCHHRRLRAVAAGRLPLGLQHGFLHHRYRRLRYAGRRARRLGRRAGASQ